ncbi:hypothetical protein MA16_Dca023490 [Dendrobium catenatum]|uniref:Uncharacterized protein n=1 Tax=Dendrobium catenatum TaxID=906689 RepID=A0A2I0WQH3_9ASPA|nr:hypothetical protein MA16_Dca023490 [Dendrobium catenatum]
MHEDVDLTHHRPISTSIQTKQQMKRSGEKNHQSSRRSGITARMPKIARKKNLRRTSGQNIPIWDQNKTGKETISHPKKLPANHTQRISPEFAQNFP